jgi:hypothetical protein
LSTGKFYEKMMPLELVNYIKKPQTLNESSIIDITLLAEKYPYFQTVQLLRVKNLHLIAPDHIKQALNYTAAFVTDRKILYYLLHPIIQEQDITVTPEETAPELETNVQQQKKHEKEVKDTIQENISDTLLSQKDYLNTNDTEEIEFSTSINIKKEYGEGIELDEFVVRINKEDADFLELLDEEQEAHEILPQEEARETVIHTEPDKTIPPEREQKEEDILVLINKGIVPENIKQEPLNLSESQKKKNALIDSFIQSKPKIKPKKNTPEENYDISSSSVEENEHFITDTLAIIYLNQGHYAKAIFAYEKLSLKYPEKSAYFADQIAEIKKRIEKNK